MDIRQTITENILAILVKGNQQQVRARWSRAATQGMPRNGATGGAYRGVNVLLLWERCLSAGYASCIWLTYRQAQALGAQVRRGEESTLCCYFEMVRCRTSGAGVTDAIKGDAECFPLCKPFRVFNAEQIDGLPASFQASSISSPFNAIPAAERLITSTGAAIVHGQAQAAYVPGNDTILLPDRERFTSPETYYATALHELTHWSGHPSRLGRAFGKRFGDAAYAFEELVAELGSAFLAGHLGICSGMIADHADYIGAWINVLQNDKTAIFTASRHAGLATDFLLGAAGLTS